MVEFDYIIIGAGSAGATLAGRLSENPHVSVLLIESGPKDRNPAIHIPGAIQKAFTDPSLTYALETVPQAHLQGRRVRMPRGRVLGGSSSVNGMVYARGMASDFQTWGQLGVRGWSFEEVLPYFRRAETYLAGETAMHGGDGPVKVSQPAGNHVLSLAFREAMQGLGFRFEEDIATTGAEGVGLLEGTYAQGRRSSTASSYLRPAQGRANLTVRADTTATRIVFEGAAARAVKCQSGKTQETIVARREIILSGGAIGSPHLLLRSGVGDPAQLKRFGIAPVVERPAVGQNLHDHVLISVQVACTKPVTYYSHVRPTGLLKLIAQYALFRSGPLATNAFEMTAFVKSRPELDEPDLQLFFLPVLYADEGRTLLKEHGYMILIELLRPRSRGSLELVSADPAVQPAIDPNYLQDPQDIAALRSALQISQRILAQPAFDLYRGRAIAPGEAPTSDHGLDAYIRQTATTAHHPVGTCRMGEDENAVVDSRLRVRGVTGLRVADASVMPQLVASGTNIPTIMIGEKAADLIREDALEMV